MKKISQLFIFCSALSICFLSNAENIDSSQNTQNETSAQTAAAESKTNSESAPNASFVSAQSVKTSGKSESNLITDPLESIDAMSNFVKEWGLKGLKLILKNQESLLKI